MALRCMVLRARLRCMVIRMVPSRCVIIRMVLNRCMVLSSVLIAIVGTRIQIKLYPLPRHGEFHRASPLPSVRPSAAVGLR